MKKWIMAGVAAVVLPGSAFAAAIIDNGVVKLGVDDFGQLNPTSVLGDPSPVTGTSVVGLRYIPTGNESTSHGCLCEGWGVGLGGSGLSGAANNSYGVDASLSAVSFASTASTATSVVDLIDGGGASILRVTHHFAPSAETSNLYRVSVSIENVSGAAQTDLRYTRTFDWDVEPDTFDEYVTHNGTATTPTLLDSRNNGFVDSDPFASRAPISAAGFLTGDFTDAGPFDHGSNFDFGFGDLAIGEVFEFDIFYGAALTEVAALASLGAVSAELFSLGQASRDINGTGVRGANTFIFGFAGVGGEVFVPDPIPVPAAIWLFGTAIAVFGGGQVFRRRQAIA